MLLRSSSAPVFSALLPEVDNESSAFNRPLAAPTTHHANPSPQNRGFPSTPPRPMRRAHSETDLQGVSLSSSTEADDQRRTGQKKKHLHLHSFSKLPVIEEKDPFLMASGIGIFTKADQALGSLYGCDGGRGSSGGNSRPSSSPNGDSNTTDLYYRKLLQLDPWNPLLLRNYAQFLSEAKHDYNKSEEYYERAILACPNDGEVLSKYAKHVWDVHKDAARAASYFDQAVKATPDDCYVVASYAAFLWEAEEDEEDNVEATQKAIGSLHETRAAPSPLVASA